MERDSRTRSVEQAPDATERKAILASGLVRRAFDGVGLTNEQVAPAGMKP